MAGVASGRASLLQRLTVFSGSQVRCWYSVFLAFRMSSLAPCAWDAPMHVHDDGLMCKWCDTWHQPHNVHTVLS
jgi:hypothetical protein